MNPPSDQPIRHLNKDSRESKDRSNNHEMDKRQLSRRHKPETNIVTLDKIPTWTEYASKHCISSESKENPPFFVNETFNSKVSVWKGDITTLKIDAIVNAANSTLLGGGGVDGAIHNAAGPGLRDECATLKGCATGQAKITLGYDLPAKHVIHTVGPIGENEKKLRNCYNNCLQQLKDNKLHSVAFPCISTGIYGYPNKPAARIALQCVRKWLEEEDNADTVDRIIFCLFLSVDVDLYDKLMAVYFPLSSPESNTILKSNRPEKTEPRITSSDISQEEKCHDLKTEPMITSLDDRPEEKYQEEKYHEEKAGLSSEPCQNKKDKCHNKKAAFSIASGDDSKKEKHDNSA